MTNFFQAVVLLSGFFFAALADIYIFAEPCHGGNRYCRFAVNYLQQLFELCPKEKICLFHGVRILVFTK
jgi:hypothetical protein